MATTTDNMYLGVPQHAGFWIFTNVQRGVVFMWLLQIIITFVVGIIRLIAGWMELEGEQYAEGKQKPPAGESSQNFDVVVAKANSVTQQDGGSKKFMKKVTELQSKYFAILVIFAFNIIAGSTYAFCLVLYFIVLIPLILFNLLGVHKKAGNKIIQGFLDNLWLILAFFWLINIWTIRKYYEPYFIYSVAVAI